MKKLLLLSLLTAIFSNLIYAQPEHRCYTDEVYQETIRNNPDVLRIQQQLEEHTAEFTRDRAMQRTSASGAPIYIIPVVFHILHNYGPENISDAQVLDAMRVINEDFNKLNSDTNLIIPQFQGIAADAQIEFRLANIDPNGNCTNGIDRIVTNLTYVANDASKLNPWPNQKYINIWVANSLERTGAAAYAFLPGTTVSQNDGIMSRYNYVGSIGASTPNNKRTLTHELGHVLNLLHPWGSGNEVGTACGDDFVNDTPITKGFQSCQTELSAQVCNPPIVENWQNFMDYSYCDVMFTQGQKTRMFAALTSGASGRNNLWTNSNLIATGTDGSPINVCVPNADFKANYTEVCDSGKVIFNDLSWNAKATSWYWEFPGGTPATSTDSMPEVTYYNAGSYDVKFVSTNSEGSDTIVRTDHIRVTGNATRTGPIFEDFEQVSSFPGADGYLYNPDNGQAFARVTGIGYSGIASVRINNYSNTDGEIDEWIMPSIDMSNVGVPVTMTFFYANAQRNSTSDDKLTVFASSNCGQVWSNRWSRSGSALSTAGVISISFTPTNIGQWQQASMFMNPYALKKDVRIKFQNISDRGNNIYIDDINITGTIVNVDEIDEVDLGFALYPNPATSETKVQFKISKTLPVQIRVTDLSGRLVSNVLDESLPAGLYEYPVKVSTPGIYLIHLMVDGKFKARKLVIPAE